MAELPKDNTSVCSAFILILIFFSVNHDSRLILLSAKLHSHKTVYPDEMFYMLFNNYKGLGLQPSLLLTWHNICFYEVRAKRKQMQNMYWFYRKEARNEK